MGDTQEENIKLGTAEMGNETPTWYGRKDTSRLQVGKESIQLVPRQQRACPGCGWPSPTPKGWRTGTPGTGAGLGKVVGAEGEVCAVFGDVIASQ